MPDSRLRSPNDARDSLLERPFTNATKGDIDELKAKVNLLEYGGITADKLGGGTISEQSIGVAENGSFFSGSPTGNGFVLDKDGLRFYAGGVNTIDLRADGGTAKFTGDISASTITGGTFQTALSGARIKISSTNANFIEFFSGHASETVSGAVWGYSTGDILELIIESPHAGYDWCDIQLFGRSTATAAQIAMQVYNDAGTSLGLVLVDSSSAGHPALFVGHGVEEINLQPTATSSQFLATASGAYTFIRLAASGVQATLNVNSGLSSGLLCLDGVNTNWVPITASAFNVASARNTKKNIRDASDPVLPKLKQLRPVKFTRPKPTIPSPVKQVQHGEKPVPDPPVQPDVFTDIDQYGFVAEEVATIFPEAVVTGADGPVGIDISALLMLAIKGIQELSK